MIPSHAILRHGDGSVSWNPLPGDLYLVTGEDADGRPLTDPPTPSWYRARTTTLRCGTVWLLRGTRRIKLIEIATWPDN